MCLNLHVNGSDSGRVEWAHFSIYDIFIQKKTHDVSTKGSLSLTELRESLHFLPPGVAYTKGLSHNPFKVEECKSHVLICTLSYF